VELTIFLTSGVVFPRGFRGVNVELANFRTLGGGLLCCVGGLGVLRRC
jgi:hypothetical protein